MGTDPRQPQLPRLMDGRGRIGHLRRVSSGEGPLMKTAVAAIVVFAALPAQAGPVERACLASQAAAQAALCGCIQSAADATLAPSEQRRVAGFFTEPHGSQELRTSSRPGDAALWARYQQFGATAERLCARG